MTRRAKTDIDVSKPLPGLRYEKADGVATITLDRPERGNALTPAMQPVMRALWADVRDDPAVRVALIAASGEKHFCTGFDVPEAEGDQADEVFANRPLSDAVFWSPYQNRVWKPVLCVVNGLCVGGGFHFVVDADVVVAARGASFTDSHVNVGMVGAVENVGLAMRLPLGSALRMTLQGKRYRMSAERAWQLGLVDELADDPADALRVARAIAADMCQNSPQAMALSKQAVWGAREQGYRQALEHAWALLRVHWAHPDFEEGPRAFAERREPRWNADPNARARADEGEGQDET